MKKTIIKFFAFAIIIATSQQLNAQLPPPPGWENPSSAVAGRLEGSVTIEGLQAQPDDYIAAFKLDGTFVGSVNIIDGGTVAYFNLTILGDDGTPGNEILMEPGGAFTLKVYDRSENTIFNVENTAGTAPAEIAAWQGSNQAPVIPSPMTIDGVAIDNGYFDFMIDAAAVFQVLPIKLSTFEIEKRSCDTYQIEWVTESELNNDFFTIERSIGDVKSFENVGKVDGSLTSSSRNTYSFTDRLDLSGPADVYYRLRQTDLDGTTTISNTIVVRYECDGKSFTAYPNPFADQLILTTLNEGSAVSVINAHGQVIYNADHNTSSIVNTNDWPMGMYMVRYITLDNTVTTLKLIKQN